MNIKNNYNSIEHMVGQINNKPQGQAAKEPIPQKTEKLSFQQILEQSKQAGEGEKSLKFSKHANQRLLSRNIDLSKNQLERLESGAQKAREKGINESLVMVDDLAFIVNVKNNTVVTAVNHKEDGVFTNIDGAVIG